MKKQINHILLLATQQNTWLHKLVVSTFLTTTVGIVIYTMYAAFHYSSNAILGRDEANFIILSSEKILAATNINEFLRSMFPSHGQHLLLGMQLVNLFTYFTFGILDRRIMNVIGVIILCIAALLLPKVRHKKISETILIYATLFPLILSPAHNACIVNASCTGNHYLGVAFSVFSLYFFTKIPENKYSFIGAEFFMLLAIFSLPAALALVPISFFILFTSSNKNKYYFIFTHVFLILFTLLFQYYLTYPDTIFSFLENTEPLSFVEIIKDTILFCATLLVILGSLFYWLNDAGYGSILAGVGIIILALLIFVALKTYKSKDKNSYSFHFYSAILFLFMILIICFGRYYSLGSSRYAVYTAFLCATLLLVFFDFLNPVEDASHTAKRIKLLICSSTISLIYYFVALHYHRPYLVELGERDEFCRHAWLSEGLACGVMIPHEEATRIIKAAIDQGIYRVEQ